MYEFGFWADCSKSCSVNARSRAKYEALGEEPPPETALYPGMVAAILVPIGMSLPSNEWIEPVNSQFTDLKKIGLFMFAFTVYRSVHWIVPIILIAPFGTGTVLAYVSTFTFLVSTYRAHAASAMASNSFARSSFAAAFPLIARPMFDTMTNSGALAFLAGLTALMAPLPYATNFTHTHTQVF